jgi:hypothetical protein
MNPLHRLTKGVVQTGYKFVEFNNAMKVAGQKFGCIKVDLPVKQRWYEKLPIIGNRLYEKRIIEWYERG